MFLNFPVPVFIFLIFNVVCFTLRTVADLMPLHLHNALSETLLALSFSDLTQHQNFHCDSKASVSFNQYTWDCLEKERNNTAKSLLSDLVMDNIIYSPKEQSLATKWFFNRTKRYQLYSSCFYCFSTEMQLSGFMKLISMTVFQKPNSSKLQLIVVTQMIISWLKQRNYAKPWWCELEFYSGSFFSRVTSEHLDCLASQTINSKQNK